MTYATKEMVKVRIGAAQSDTRQDVQIGHALTWADVKVNSAFEEVNETVPSVVPNVIKEIAADFATYFVLRNKNQAAAKSYLDSAEVSMGRYIDMKYRPKTLL